MKNQTDNIMRPEEVAQLFKVSVRTVARWADQGLLPHFKTVGGHHRYRRAEVEAILEATAGEITR